MRLRATWLLLALSAACTATPIPLPPPENLDVGKIVFPESWPATTGIMFSGEPGAAPPNSIIRVTNLETMDPPAAIQVASDGSFEASLNAELDDELRFQVRVGDERKPPIDLVYIGGDFAPAERIDCFTASVELGFGSVANGSSADATIQFTNDCPADALISPVVFRTGDAAFTLGPETPTDIPANTSAGFVLTFTPAVAGDAEEVLLFGVEIDGESARYPVTLFGAGE